MPVIHRAHAPVFEQHGATFTGLAAPSRGARETAVWEVCLPPGAPAVEHSLTREEIFVVLAGRALATLGGELHDIGPGDALVVPPSVPFSLANPHAAPLRAIAVLPVGGQGQLTGEAPFTPPWAA